MKLADQTYNQLLEGILVERKSASMKELEADLIRAMRSTKASLQVEGLHVTDQEASLVLSRMMGDISQAEFLQRAKEASLHVR